MQWPPSWEPVIPEAKQALEAELECETRYGHPLYSVPVEAIARRDDCDEALFSLNDSFAVAIVHLSYSIEEDPLWPHTRVFGSLSKWAEQAVRSKDA